VDGGGGTAGSISISVATVSFGTRYITVIQVEPVFGAYHIRVLAQFVFHRFYVNKYTDPTRTQRFPSITYSTCAVSDRHRQDLSASALQPIHWPPWRFMHLRHPDAKIYLAP
jgi:hypothetical protein